MRMGPEQVESRDVVVTMALIDYFKQIARRVYATSRDAGPLDGLADDLARFLELHRSEWSGKPQEP